MLFRKLSASILTVQLALLGCPHVGFAVEGAANNDIVNGMPVESSTMTPQQAVEAQAGDRAILASMTAGQNHGLVNIQKPIYIFPIIHNPDPMPCPAPPSYTPVPMTSPAVVITPVAEPVVETPVAEPVIEAPVSEAPPAAPVSVLPVQPVLVTAMTSAAAPTQMPEVNPVRMAVPAAAVTPANAAVKAGSLVSAQTGNGNRPNGADTLRDLLEAVNDVDLLLDNHPVARLYRHYGRIERSWGSVISFVSTGDRNGGAAVLQALQRARVALNVQLQRAAPGDQDVYQRDLTHLDRVITGIQSVHDRGWPQPYMFTRAGEQMARNVIQEARTGFGRIQVIDARVNTITAMRPMDPAGRETPQWRALQQESNNLRSERARILANISSDMSGSLERNPPPNPAQRAVMEMMRSLVYFDTQLEAVRFLRWEAGLYRNNPPNSNTGGGGTGR